MTVPETLLFISTLDGNLHAVSKSTGDVRWTLKDGECQPRAHPTALRSPGTALSLHGCWQRALVVLLAVTILGLTCK